MGKVKVLSLAVLGLLAACPRAGAAGAISYGTSDSPAQVPVHDSSGIDWNGFYAGIYGVGQSTGDDGASLSVGARAGVNLSFDFYLVGAEVAVHGLAGDDAAAYGQLVGRAGLVVTDDLVAFASAGYGMELGDSGDNHLLLGGGLEVAVTEDFSVNAQYLHGFGLDDSESTDQFSLGANFHF